MDHGTAAVVFKAHTPGIDCVGFHAEDLSEDLQVFGCKLRTDDQLQALL
jgi:hypothetical protein